MNKHNLQPPLPCLAPQSDRGRPPLLGSKQTALLRGASKKVSPAMSLAEFVGIKFLPEYIEQKSFAGRKHYQAMLKHILRPETVDQLFNPIAAELKSRLRAIPDWPYLDEVKVCELEEHHVRDLTSAALALGYSSQTVKHIRNVLGVIIAHAQRERLFAAANPVFGVELPPISHKTPQDLTIAQAMAMLKMMRYPEREIALIAITTGISIQEICGLQWKHVNLTKTDAVCDGHAIPPGSILLEQHWNPEGIVQLLPNRIRLIKVPEPLAATLLRLKHKTLSSDPNAFVLSTPSGAPVRPTSLRMTRLKTIGRRISIPDLSWQLVRRAHDAMLSELRVQLNNDLVSSAR